MEIGIVGLPNVGKSSLFNALTAAQVPSENFPFTTIEPNVGVVPVNDERLDYLMKLFEAPKKVAASVRFVDIAGLVPGASKGEGLGNKFLAHIREVDAIAHVVRCFDDKDVINVMGELDPSKAADVITTELLLCDLETAEKAKDKLHGNARSGDEEARKKTALLEGILQKIQQGIVLRKQGLNDADIKEFNFLTAKPVLFVANLNGSETSERCEKMVQEWAKQEGAECVSINAKLEAEIMALPVEERLGYREALGAMESGIDRLAKAGEKLLQLITFFAAGPKEAHAWHVRRGTPVVQAAGKIHTDLERGFIRAEVYNVADLKEAGSEAALKAKGKIRMEGREYITKDGDVLNILFKV